MEVKDASEDCAHLSHIGLPQGADAAVGGTQGGPVYVPKMAVVADGAVQQEPRRDFQVPLRTRHVERRTVVVVGNP
jgi:hypothetical protein